MNSHRPRVGLGVIIKNQQGQILVMKRSGKHAPFWSIPGGNLELGETLEAGAAREIQEELGLTLADPRVIAVTNNLQTYRSEGVHYISVVLLADRFAGEPKIMEPHKCEAIEWVDPHQLPQLHFDASEMAVRCYLDGVVYVQPTLS